MVDKKYCMSSYLMYRTVANRDKIFKEGWIPNWYNSDFKKKPVCNSKELYSALKSTIDNNSNKKLALALSGGIDSAILAKMMPKGSKAYTFQCVVPGVQTVSEVEQAQKYAEECGLEHEVVPIYWDDMKDLSIELMTHKKAPIHSIEVQIYKAAKKAKEDGFDAIVFGESADLNYGGLSNLLSKDWTVGDFIDRYSYVLPYKVLKNWDLVLSPVLQYEMDGYIDVFEFCRGFFLEEAMGSYTNACETANIELICPYVNTYLDDKLDYARIRQGENKYLVRELFGELYKDFSVPPKLPMPRATNEWFKDWKGPKREEFWRNCADGMTGDQKWMLYALEKFLNIIDEQDVT